jgi:hypothetical protein
MTMLPHAACCMRCKHGRLQTPDPSLAGETRLAVVCMGPIPREWSKTRCSLAMPHARNANAALSRFAHLCFLPGASLCGVAPHCRHYALAPNLSDDT